MPDGRDAPADAPIRIVAASLCVAVTLIGCEETPVDPGRTSEEAPAATTTGFQVLRPR